MSGSEGQSRVWQPKSAGRASLAALGAWLAASFAASGPSSAQLPAGARVVVLAPNETDGRIEPAREAIRYWNRAFEELGLAPIFTTSEVVVDSPATRALENYARQVSRRAGFSSAGQFEPDPPEELAALEADVVVLLSVQKLIPFAWPLPRTRSRRYFLAADADPDAAAGGALRVIAHELGHALGLRHHRGDPAALMCMPCRRSPANEGPALPPLTERERSRLVGLYAPPGRGAAPE